MKFTTHGFLVTLQVMYQGVPVFEYRKLIHRFLVPADFALWDLEQEKQFFDDNKELFFRAIYDNLIATRGDEYERAVACGPIRIEQSISDMGCDDDKFALKPNIAELSLANLVAI